MYKVGDKIVYPGHGAGTIMEKYVYRVGKEEVEYYKITFFHTDVTVSVPIKRAAEMGMRKPLTAGKLREMIKIIGNRKNINQKTDIDKFAKEKLASGQFKEAIDLFNATFTIAKSRRDEGKARSQTNQVALDKVKSFLASEIKIVLGDNALKEHELPLED